MKSHSGEQVNLLGSCFPVKGMSYERMLYAVRCLKSNEDMILALAGQFKQLSHEPEKFRVRWVRIPLSHLNFSGSCDNCLNCPASARIISSFDFKHRTAYNILSYDIPFTGKHEPNKLTCSPLCDFIAQMVRALHRHRRGHGFESR